MKRILDRLYREYDFEVRLRHDPIEFPHRYKRPEDIEVSGLISSCFAYGRVDSFKRVIERILPAMGDSPYGFLADFNPKKHGRLFSGLKYRFNENSDIVCMLFALSEVIRKYGGIEAVFRRSYSDDDRNIGGGMSGMVDALLGIDTSPVYGKNIRTYGFRQFFPSPADGSACKRMNLFLRWMVRDKDIDLGIWKGVPKNRLVIPLDTHIARISRCIGFTERAAQDWKTAVEITEALKSFDARDPLKYDFALCHQGIAKVCSKMRCSECALKGRLH